MYACVYLCSDLCKYVYIYSIKSLFVLGENLISC